MGSVAVRVVGCLVALIGMLSRAFAGRRAVRGALLTCLTSVALLSASPASAQTGNLLAQRAPVRNEGFHNVAVLSDGIRAHNGDAWKTNLTATFTSGSAFVQFDLGAELPIDAAFLQGDNNDTYILSLSNDGRRFRELWRAPAVDGAGLQPRFTSGLRENGRFLRVSARGGDGAYSLSELQLFSSVPTPFPPVLQVQGGTSGASRVRDATLLFVLAFAAFLALCRRGATLRTLLLLGLAPAITAYLLVATLLDAWPVGNVEVSLLRAAAAAIAAIALLRQRALRDRFPVHPRAVLAALGVSAALAFSTFYNLGHFQFWDHERSKPEFVHTWDMRVYYPFTKYFEELRYDGVYQASMLAYVEDTPTTLQAIGATEIRNMKTHRMQRVAEVADEIHAIKNRFTPERWSEFKRDMTYFREVMGPTYLTTHHDHGSNATPLWVACAKLIFDGRPATEGVLVFGGLVDLGLLLVLFGVIWRTFGVRLALLAFVVFGANDYYMFGTDWAGATLRHDWLAYLGFGICALRAERWWLAGMFFGLSTMIRAFPGAALIGVSLPAVWWFAETWLKTGRLPTPKQLLEAHGAAARVLAGAAACMLFTLAVTGLWFGFGVWAEWWRKVTLLNSDVGANDVSLKVLLGETRRVIAHGLMAQAIVYRAAFLLCIAVIVLACRRRRLDQAALLSLPLIPVLTNPANYYIHFIFLLPLLAQRGGEGKVVKERVLQKPPRENEAPKETTALVSATPGDVRAEEVATEQATPGEAPREDAPREHSRATTRSPALSLAPALTLSVLSVVGPLLAICVAQYWMSLDPDIDRRFGAATALLFAGLGWIYVRVLQRDGML